VSYTDIMAVLTSLPTVMQRYLAEGHTVKLEGIGTLLTA
jgi:nucleoid DNA-binding protein